MNQTCPNCGYVLHRDNHPIMGIIRFCRRSCVRNWLYRHNRTADAWLDGDIAERRVS